MLEQETETIKQVLADRTIGPRRAIIVHEIEEADIPRGIKAYLLAEVMQWLRQDLRSTRSFSRLDIESPGTVRIEHAFLRTLARAYVFPREEFLLVLDNAVHFLENYLCRPRWTLQHFVFEEKERVPLEEARARFAYIAEYEYLPRLIDLAAQRKGWTELHAPDFQHLVSRIDDEVVNQHSPRELAGLAMPIFEFLRLASEPAEDTIPVKPLLVFFADKSMTFLQEYIENICRIRNQDRISQLGLAELTDDLYQGGGKPDYSAPSHRDRVAGEPTPALPDTPPPELPSAPVTVPAPETYQEKPSDTSPPAESQPRQEPPPRTPVRPHTPLNPALSLTFSGMKESGPTLPDINTLIDERQRDRFIRKIFLKNEIHYLEVIGALNAARTWKDASLYLNRFFEINDLNPFADEVIEFTDVIEKRFTPVHGKTA